MGPDDWIQAALDAIAEGGLAAVTIDALAERVEATKGSFYWHFASRDAVVTAALEEWERAESEAVIERVRVVRDPEERLRALTLAAFEDRAGGLRDAALSASAEDPLVGPVLRRVTARRIGYLTELFEELGWVGRRARQRAVMVYASYVGLFHFLRASPDDDLTGGDVRAYTDELLDALTAKHVRDAT